MRRNIATFCSYLVCTYWGLTLGKRNRFYGVPIIRRHPTASINIGSDCVFRSAEWSNSVGLNRRCYISAEKGAKISIGDDSGFSGAIIAASKSIVIGSRVLCGANCTIVDTDRHPLSSVERTTNASAQSAPIRIGDDVFVGMNVVILKGSTIGDGAVIGANSVVSGPIPARTLAAGSPARVIRDIS